MESSRFSRSDSSPFHFRVALAGFGNVGRAVAQLLLEEGPRFREELGLSFELSLILDRSYRRKETNWLPQSTRMTDQIDEFLQAPADVVVELLGGTEPAHRIILESLAKGKAVVTANKALIARCGSQYFEVAAEHQANFGFEASVAGGIPIIRALHRSFFADRILGVRGILNGTCNFILTEMGSTGREFSEVLSEAQKRGYAEADPFLDISGRDAADKLAILASLCFKTWISAKQVPVRGISEITPIDFVYARSLNCSIKLLGTAGVRNSHLHLRVSPFLVDNRLPLSKISGAMNAIELSGRRLGSSVLMGLGAGGDATAVAVVSDILNAALASRPGGEEWKPYLLGCRSESNPLHGISEDAEKYPFYLRFCVNDQPGIIAALAAILAGHGINIDAVLQEKWPDPSSLPFTITVAPTSFSTIQAAVEEMARLDFNQLPPLAYPILTA